MNEPEVLLVYDHQCPVCDAYCKRVQLRAPEGRLRLIDAREPSTIRDEITRRGLDIDQGMVLHTADGLFCGAEAIHQLALVGRRSDPFNLLNYAVFHWRWASEVIYPMLRFFRNMLLKLLGRTKINNLGKPDNEKF